MHFTTGTSERWPMNLKIKLERKHYLNPDFKKCAISHSPELPSISNGTLLTNNELKCATYKWLQGQ